jgi:Holliday junction resolvase RusA-like endonuclease
MTAYDPAKSRNWKATAQEHMLTARGVEPPLQGPVSCEIAATFTCPRGDWRKQPRQRRWHAKKPDAENVSKAVLDAATGVLWLDDSQVAHLVVVKVVGRQGEGPQVWVKVSSITTEPAR